MTRTRPPSPQLGTSHVTRGTWHVHPDTSQSGIYTDTNTLVEISRISKVYFSAAATVAVVAGLLDTVFTRNVDISAGCPYLRSLLAVPAEGEDVVAGAELGRHLHLVHHREQEQREPGERGVGPEPVQAWAQRIVKVSVDERSRSFSQYLETAFNMLTCMAFPFKLDISGVHIDTFSKYSVTRNFVVTYGYPPTWARGGELRGPALRHAVSLQVECAAVWLGAGGDGVPGPLGARGPGARHRPVGAEHHAAQRTQSRRSRGGASYLGPESPYCTHCVSPLNLSTVCWKHSSVSASPSAGPRHRR